MRLQMHVCISTSCFNRKFKNCCWAHLAQFFFLIGIYLNRIFCKFCVSIPVYVCQYIHTYVHVYMHLNMYSITSLFLFLAWYRIFGACSLERLQICEELLKYIHKFLGIYLYSLAVKDACLEKEKIFSQVIYL